MGALNSTSPIQNSVGSPTSPSDINDTKISTETTPKPRKFFKSRNAAPPAEIQQQIAIQQQMAMQQQLSQHQSSNHVQSSPEEQPLRISPKKQKRQAAPKKEKIEKPKVEKPPKVKKLKAPKVKEVKEVVPLPEGPSDSDDEVLSPPRRGRQANNNESTRHSGRVRGKINYNEDEGEEEFIMRTEKRIAPKQLKLLQQQQQQLMLQQQQEQQEQERLQDTAPINLPVETQNHSEASSSPAINHPPIVLRISKVSFKSYDYFMLYSMYLCIAHNYM